MSVCRTCSVKVLYRVVVGGVSRGLCVCLCKDRGIWSEIKVASPLLALPLACTTVSLTAGQGSRLSKVRGWLRVARCLKLFRF